MYSRSSILKRFLPARGGNRKTQEKENEKETESDLVVFIHGLFLSGHVFYPMARHLAAQGWEGIVYDYPTRLKNVCGHGEDLARFLDELCEKENGRKRKIVLVTHSLGGIVVRAASGLWNSRTENAIRKILMIVPPNRGSDMARLACALFPPAGKLSRVLPDLSSSPDAAVHRLPLLHPGKQELAIFGARYDLEVREKSYHLPGECLYRRFPCGHTDILFRKEIFSQVESFLQTPFPH